MMSTQAQSALEQHHPSCFTWALACCRWNRDEAQEVLQIAYLRILEGRASLNGTEISRPWIFGVIRRTALEHKRRRVVRTLALERWWRRQPETDLSPSPSPDTGDLEARHRLRGLLARLSTRQRELLHLVFYQDMTIEQASEVLGISLGTARVHYERAKTRLRRLLTQEPR